ncbi:MAG: hypothetical protein C5B51_32200 [Terriglobia bacterium]|nr:MAG: hypothetical protein C5B51_32200 [Terriglobia bacterium]
MSAALAAVPKWLPASRISSIYWTGRNPDRVTPEEQRRLESLEERVAHLESVLQARMPEAPRSAPPSAAAPAAAHSSHILETALGLTWISRIGVITVVLALAFFFEYAFENHWISELGRVGLGLACGAAALFFGERLWRAGQLTYAQALTAAGVSFLYLSFWAAFALYQMLEQPAAFGLMFLTAGLAGVLALRYDGAAIASMALLSGYATPFLLGRISEPGPILGYLLVIAVAGLAFSDRRAWSGTAFTAFAGLWAAYGVWRAQLAAPPPFGLTLLFLTASLALFLAWPLWRVRRRRQILRVPDLLILAVNPGFYFAACYSLLERGYESYAGLLAVILAFVEAGAAQLLGNHDRRGNTLAVAMAWVLFVLAAPLQFAGYRVTIAWALEGAAIAWIGVRAEERRALYGSAAVFALVLLHLAFSETVMYATPASYTELINARFLTFFVSAAALCGTAWWIRRGTAAGSAYVASQIVLLWGLCLEILGWAARTAAPQDVASVASTALSVMIAVYAVLLVAAGVLWRHAPTRLLGMVFIGLVVAKLYLYDVWLLGQFYRMAAFAILGLLLLVMSYLYSRFRGSLEHWWRT